MFGVFEEYLDTGVSKVFNSRVFRAWKVWAFGVCREDLEAGIGVLHQWGSSVHWRDWNAWTFGVILEDLEAGIGVLHQWGLQCIGGIEMLGPSESF